MDKPHTKLKEWNVQQTLFFGLLHVKEATLMVHVLVVLGILPYQAFILYPMLSSSYLLSIEALAVYLNCLSLALATEERICMLPCLAMTAISMLCIFVPQIQRFAKFIGLDSQFDLGFAIGCTSCAIIVFYYYWFGEVIVTFYEYLVEKKKLVKALTCSGRENCREPLLEDNAEKTFNRSMIPVQLTEI